MIEYKRLGIQTKNNEFLKVLDNSRGQYCSSYPFKIIVPKFVTKELIKNSSKARNRNRFPILTYQIKDIS